MSLFQDEGIKTLNFLYVGVYLVLAVYNPVWLALVVFSGCPATFEHSWNKLACFQPDRNHFPKTKLRKRTFFAGEHRNVT